jgi:hypothetical protein
MRYSFNFRKSAKRAKITSGAVFTGNLLTFGMCLNKQNSPPFLLKLSYSGRLSWFELQYGTDQQKFQIRLQFFTSTKT